MSSSLKNNSDSKKDTTATAKAGRSQAASYDIARSDETLDLAKDLAKFIKENRLSTQVQGKEFVNVEGWQYAGSRLGIVPIVEHTINVSHDQEIKYQAKVTLFDMRSQQTVGAGFAVCSNKESGKKFYQEFAIMSMAQTRAIGKAYRNILAWIIRAAGYEPTPAEEMDYAGNVPAPAAAVAEPAPVMRAVTNEPLGDPLAASQPPVQYAKAVQKEEIIHLLNHPLITRQEKTKMLLNINRLDEERATQAIAKLQKAIEDRKGTSAVAEGNESAGETPAQHETPAENNSAAPAASTGSEASAKQEQARIERVSAGFTKASAEFDAHVASHSAPTNIPPEVLGRFTRQFEAATSGIDVKALWDKLTAPEKKALEQVKEAAKARCLAAGQQAGAVVARQEHIQMKEAGADDSLVAEFGEQPVVPGVEPITYATTEQKEAIIRLLNHPLITRREKTYLLLKLNKPDKERARQAIIKLRSAIESREGTSADERNGLRTALAGKLSQGAHLNAARVRGWQAVLEDANATAQDLTDALSEISQELSLDDLYETGPNHSQETAIAA